MQRQESNTSDVSKLSKSSLSRLWERTSNLASHVIPGLHGQTARSIDSFRSRYGGSASSNKSNVGITSDSSWPPPPNWSDSRLDLPNWNNAGLDVAPSRSTEQPPDPKWTGDTDNIVSSPSDIRIFAFDTSNDGRTAITFRDGMRSLWYRGKFLLPDSDEPSDGSNYCFLCQDPFKIVEHKTILRLGTMTDIRLRDFCPICRLVYFSLEKYVQTMPPNSNKIFQEEVVINPRPAPGAVILDVLCGSQQRAQLIAMAESEVAIKTTFSGDVTSTLSLLTDTNYSLYEFARFCITNCSREHPNCTWGDYGMTQLQILLIDVYDMCLKRVIFDYGKVIYVALSYVNGDEAILRTLESNLESHLQPHAFGLGENLCQTVRDAIDMTRALNIRYLWVDSLSIVQDNASTKHQQISNMNEIYANAFLTIAAFSGQKASSGLPGVQKSSRHPITAATYSSTPCHPSGSYRGENPGGCIFVSWPSGLNQVQDIAPYETRSWTFQEKSLSKRTLFVSHNQALFICRNAALHETDHAILTASNSMAPKYHEWMTDVDINASLGINPDNLANFYPLLNEQTSIQDPLARWSLYRSLVAEYTKRQLTFPSDIINAFAGATKFLEETWATPFTEGLPITLLNRCLFWIPQGPISRRKPESDQAPRFASWSWAGWTGSVDYLVDDIATRSSYEHCIPYYILLRRNQQPLCILPSADGFADSFELAPGEPPLPLSVRTTVLRFNSRSISLESLTFYPNTDQDCPNRKFTAIYDMASQRCGLLVTTVLADLPPSARHEYKLILHSRMAPRVSAHGGSTIYLPDGRVAAFDDGYSKLPVTTWVICNVILVRETGGWCERVDVGWIHSDVWEQLGHKKEDVWLL